MTPTDRPLEELVTLAMRDGVAQVTLNRPEAGNALTPAMRDRLREIIEDASSDLETRAILLTGTGKSFCTGADFRGTSSDLPPGPPEEGRDHAIGDVARIIQRGWQRLITAMLDCDKPLICAVNGTAAGGGAHLVLASDLVVMAMSSRLIEVFIRRAIVPDGGGAYLLPRHIGLARSKALVLLGDDLSASDAHAMGLCYSVVADEELPRVAGDLAARVASGPTVALGMAKRMLNRSFDMDRRTSFDQEALFQELNHGAQDGSEGVLSFMEGRPPAFKGW